MSAPLPGAPAGETPPPWRRLYPFADRYLRIGGHALHYLDEGPPEAETLVFLHGNPTWSFYYRNALLSLRDRYRCIAPDHMGMGLSARPEGYAYTLATHVDNLETLLAHLGVESATLVLHDWGGAIGMGWAARHPERVRRLVILNTAAFFLERIAWQIAFCRIPLLGALLLRGGNLFVEGALWMAVAHHERLTPAVKAGYRAPYGDWAAREAVLRFVQDIPMRPDHPGRPELERIEAALPRFRETPALIQWGGRDFVFDAHFLAEWRRHLPQAAVDVYEDAGHYVLEDAHERILPRLEEFLACTRP